MFEGIRILRDAARGICLQFVIREVDHDLDGLVAREFTRPADDVLLRLAVQVAFPKRKRIERVKQLIDVVDTQRDHIIRARQNYAAVAPATF